MPWFKFAQYDASIEQPLIRNAGEALGVTALLNLSDAYPEDRLWRSSVHINTLGWIEDMLRARSVQDRRCRHRPKFGGLLAPKWPSQILDDAWKLKTDRIERGRAIYAEMCSGCHLPAVDTPAFWSSKHWEPSGDSKVLNAVTIPTERDQDGSRTVARAQQQGCRCARLPEGEYGRPPDLVAMRRLRPRARRPEMVVCARPR